MSTSRPYLAVLLLLFFLVSAALVSAAPALQPGAAPSPLTEDARGAWKETTGNRLLLWEPARLILRSADGLQALAILARDAGQITVRNSGLRETWRVSRNAESLRIEHNGHSEEYRRLLTVPPELDLSPLPLGHPATLSPERVKEIQGELVRRRDLDQVVRKDPAQKERWPAVDADNFVYLERLVQEVGWIDSTRFGKPASAAAILLAKHGDDPRLMQAILPLVKEDLQRNPSLGQLFSVLYDGLQIRLGRKQRYGTQLADDAKGPFVLPMEDPARVNELRKDIGLAPLSEYLAKASTYLYDGKAIRILSED